MNIPPQNRSENLDMRKPHRSNLVIGLTGPLGSGCGAMRRVLEGLGFESFRISDYIREELRREGKVIPKGKRNWRRVLQDQGNKRRMKDRSYWIDKVLKSIDEKVDENAKIAIDGFRNIREVQAIRAVYPRFFLVAIYAEKDERWKRVLHDYKGNYNEFDRDDRRDRDENLDWGQTVQKCVDDADYVYYNNDHLVVYLNPNKESPDLTKIQKVLKNQAKDFVPLMEGTLDARPPDPKEIYMAAAYTHSNSSTCPKRHVGAVITFKKDGLEIPISAGFNENPHGVIPCLKQEYPSCCKDEDMFAKMKALKNIHCPVCGAKRRKLDIPWICKKCGASFQEWFYRNRNMELCTAIHAEERAISSLAGRSEEGSTLYVTTFPCFQCARMVLDARVKKVVFVEAYPTPETTGFLVKNRVTIEPFTGFTARAFFRVFSR